MADKKPLILVVEDEPTVRSLVCLALRKEGFEVIEAEHPLAARQLISQGSRHVDLLFIDVLMPHMSGEEFAKELRNQKADLKVVFATGSKSAELRRRTDLVEHVLLEKPYTLNEMKRVVREALCL